jgi:PAS domain S-box-containing protein
MGYGDGNEIQKFETAMEATGLAWWWMELPSGVVFFSPNKAKMLGRKPEDFVHYKNFTDLVHPDDYPKIMQDMRNHLEDKAEIYETTYRIKHKNGDYIRFFDKGRIVGRKGKEVYLAGFVFDAEEDKDFNPLA